MASKKMTLKQKNELQNCFNSFDSDGSGHISTAELGNICEKLGFVLTERDLNNLMELMDTDHSGQIDFKEFADKMGEQFYKQPTEKELMEAFSYFDSDNNGYITENELYQVMTRFRGGVTREEVDRMVRGCDHDSDGKINKNEFIQILLKE